MKRTLTAEDRERYRSLDVPRADWGLPSGLIIGFAHSLQVPAGKHVNTPLRLRPFQIAFIRDVYNGIDELGARIVRNAVLSVARRNGKTLLASVILLAHLVGPMKRPNATIVSAATTRKQAGILFRFVRDMVRVNPVLIDKLKVLDGAKRIVHRVDGSTYEAISAEAGGQFGMGLALVVYDELAQAKNRDLYDALTTSMGSEVEPLMMVISTQAPSDMHLLSELIDYGQKVNDGILFDPSFVCHLHTVPIEAKLDDESQWSKANPGLGDYRDRKEMRDAIKRAIAMPNEEATVRVYYLNQRVEANTPFITKSVYERNSKPIVPEIFTDGRPVFGGLDLSSTIDLSALVLAAEDDEHEIHLMPFAWTPADTLTERAHRDRAHYDVWSRNGHLVAVPGRAIDYEYIAMQLGELVGTMNIVRINFDRWGIARFKLDMARLGVTVPLEPLGQGWHDMGPAVKAFTTEITTGRIRHGGHPVMRWCFANAIATADPAGNRKLDKSKSYGRIDVAVAAVMAVAAMKTSAIPPLEIAALVA